MVPIRRRGFVFLRMLKPLVGLSMHTEATAAVTTATNAGYLPRKNLRHRPRRLPWGDDVIQPVMANRRTCAAAFHRWSTTGRNVRTGGLPRLLACVCTHARRWPGIARSE